MASIPAAAQHGKASTDKKTFGRTTTVSQIINADASAVWALLTNASDYARWNSTVVAISGQIKQGEKIKLKSTLDPKRIFKLKVKEATTNQRLVWGDAMGERVYTLEENAQGTIFTMTESIGGLMFPLFANKIPSFDASFEQFAADLKREAEAKNEGGGATAN